MTTPDFTEIMTRTGSAAELPIQLADELVIGTIRESTALTLGKQVPTSTRDSRVPVLTTLPDANWLSTPDVGLEQTTQPIFANETLVAEELATIAIIPNTIVDDSQFNLWAAVKPLLTQAMAKAVDNAILFGINSPSTFPPSLVAAATAAGTTIAGAASSADPVTPVLEAAGQVSSLGYTARGAVLKPGWQYQAGVFRSNSLFANPAGADTPYPLILGGLPLHPDPLRWSFSAADAIVADWNLVLVGMRQDISMTVFNTGVISDSSGVVTMNLMQQNATACRVVMRVGYYLATPPTDTNPTDVGLTALCPVSVVTPYVAPSG